MMQNGWLYLALREGDSPVCCWIGGHAAANGKPEMRFTMALTHEEIASMAGTSRETVTRLLNQFRRDQWITIKGASMTIVKPDQLERLTA